MPFTQVRIELNGESTVDPSHLIYSSLDRRTSGFCNRFGDYAWTASDDVGFDANGKFDVYV